MNLFIYLSIYLSICLSIIYPSIHPSIHPSIYLSIYLSMCVCVCTCALYSMTMLHFTYYMLRFDFSTGSHVNVGATLRYDPKPAQGAGARPGPSAPWRSRTSRSRRAPGCCLFFSGFCSSWGLGLRVSSGRQSDARPIQSPGHL